MNIIDKIKKLMAIANDPSASDQEIQLATYRANKLMLKHKITELELNEDNNGDIIQKTTNQYYTGYLYWTFRNICKYNLQDNNKQKHIDLNMHRSSSYE